MSSGKVLHLEGCLLLSDSGGDDGGPPMAEVLSSNSLNFGDCSRRPRAEEALVPAGHGGGKDDEEGGVSWMVCLWWMCC